MKNKYLLLIPLLVLIDQITKFLVKDKILIIFNSPLILYTENTGAAFGILSGNNLLLISIMLIVIGILGYFYYKEPKLKLGLVFLFSGAVGNLMDRIFRGFVIDYLNFGIYPAFNLADVFNVVGLVIIVVVITKR